MTRGTTLALAIGLALAAARAPVAHASPPDTIGLGSRSIALAGAVSADVEDFSAGYYNPAGLAREEGLRLSVGYLRLRSMLSINDEPSDLEPVGATTLGIVAPGRFGDVRFAFGLAVLLNDQRMSRTRTAVLDRPRWELYDTRVHKVFLSTNLALRPLPWLALGGGITFQAPSELSLVVRGNIDAADPDRTRLEHRFVGDLRAIRYPQAGVQIDPTEEWSIGLTYRGAFEIDSVVVADASGDVTLLGIPVSHLELLLVSRSLSTYGPPQVVLGASFHRDERVRIGADLAWIGWSGHPSLIPDEDVTIVLENADLLGIDLPDEIVGRKPIPLRLRDVWVPRIGAEGRVLARDGISLFARGGYAYERTPFPEQTGVTNFLDGDRHLLTCGLGLLLDRLEPTLRGGLRIDAHLVWAILPERVHTKESLVDPVGDLVAGGHQVGGGLQLEVLFE